MSLINEVLSRATSFSSDTSLKSNSKTEISERRVNFFSVIFFKSNWINLELETVLVASPANKTWGQDYLSALVFHSISC